MSDERTVEPSRRRIDEARGAGRVPQSRELSAAAALLAVLAVGQAVSDDLTVGLLGFLDLSVESMFREGTALVDHARRAAVSVARPLLAIGVAGWLASILAHQIQVGGLFSPGLARPDARRLGGRGSGQDESGTGSTIWADRLRPMLERSARLAVVAGVAFVTLRGRWGSLLDAMGGADADALAAIGSVAETTLLRTAMALAALGLVDYALEYGRWRGRLRSTPQEAREERRALEGDPGARSRRQAAAARAGVVAPRLAARAAAGVDAVGGSSMDGAG